MKTKALRMAEWVASMHRILRVAGPFVIGGVIFSHFSIMFCGIPPGFQTPWVAALIVLFLVYVVAGVLGARIVSIIKDRHGDDEKEPYGGE